MKYKDEIKNIMVCKCGAINNEMNLRELNLGYINSYYCPGGFRKDGRYSPAHIEPEKCIENMTRKTQKDVTKSYKKLWKNAEYILDLAQKAEPELWNFVKSLNQDEMMISHFLDFFLDENTGKFCHQVPIPEFDDWIVTSIDEMNGESLPYSRKIFPHEIIINDVKFKKHELLKLIDIRNVIIWDLEAFYGQN